MQRERGTFGRICKKVSLIQQATKQQNDSKLHLISQRVAFLSAGRKLVQKWDPLINLTNLSARAIKKGLNSKYNNICLILILNFDERTEDEFNQTKANCIMKYIAYCSEHTSCSTCFSIRKFLSKKNNKKQVTYSLFRWLYNLWITSHVTWEKSLKKCTQLIILNQWWIIFIEYIGE